MGSFGRRSGWGRASTTLTSLPALRRHYRVCPQWLVVGSRADPAGSLAACAGQERQRRSGGCCASGALVGLRGGVGGAARGRDRSELRAVVRVGQIVRAGVRERSLWGRRSGSLGLTTPPEGGVGCARSSRGLRRLGTEVLWRPRVSLAGDRRSGRDRGPAAAEAEAGVCETLRELTRAWPPPGGGGSCSGGRARWLPPGRAPAEAGAHAEDTQRDDRRHLPWGSVPFGEISTGDRWRVGLPHRHLPSPGFLTLSTV